MNLNLIPASNYTIEQLTEAYNHTRVDYLVAMPMSATRLQEYVDIYHIDLDRSLVVKENGMIIGLGMLGLRENRSWITRLGLVADQRGKGAGQALMEGLLANSDALGIEKNMLEVIKGNPPAHQLFLKLGFENFRELLILRRAQGQVPESGVPAVDLDLETCLERLEERSGAIAWTNQTETLHEVHGLKGFRIEMPGGGSGWMVYQQTLFNLSRLMFETDGPDPVETMKALLGHLHARHPNTDTYTENIPANDPRLPAFEEFGYIETFRRIEMVRCPEL